MLITYYNICTSFFILQIHLGGDHGVKAQGDGWLLTVALIEGHKLAAVDLTGSSDPYVVFSCNGMMKTSSIKFQTLAPQWNGMIIFPIALISRLILHQLICNW